MWRVAGHNDSWADHNDSWADHNDSPAVVIEPPGNRDDSLRRFTDDLICDMDCTVHLDVLFCVRVRVGCARARIGRVREVSPGGEVPSLDDKNGRGTERRVRY